MDRWMRAMRSGDFEAAWRETDALEEPRRKGECAVQPHHLLWDGSPFGGRNVLVRCRHGLGDSIQFLRYVPLIAGARSVSVDVQPELRGLLGYQACDEFDLEIECMELPYAFRTTVHTIPAHVPYLRAKRGPSLPAGYNAGLVWAAGEWNQARSVSLAELAPLGCLPGVTWNCLQQGPRLRELDSAPFSILPLSDQTRDLSAAAAAMQELDLIVTVDTVTAHLAGALGKPVWTLLPFEADWRWMEGRQDCPWYPSMRLFRQKSPGDWPSAVYELCAAAQAGLPGQR